MWKWRRRRNAATCSWPLQWHHHRVSFWMERHDAEIQDRNATPATHVYIHHTDTPSCSSSTLCAARVRSIQNHHMNTNGQYIPIFTDRILRMGKQWRIQDFPQGCADSQKCYYFSNICWKLHENERIWTPRGARVPGSPPPWICQWER